MTTYPSFFKIWIVCSSLICIRTFNLAEFAYNQAFKLTGRVGSQLGLSISEAGDVNKDGSQDFVFASGGTVYVVYGGPNSVLLSNTQLSTSPLDPSQTGFTIKAEGSTDKFGTSVSGAGDVNGDGYDDIIIGAYGNNGFKGAAYVVYGRPNALLDNIDLSAGPLDPTTTGIKISGAQVDDNLGFSVSGGGDINNDGLDDIIIGAPGKNTGKGMAYVIYGNPSGTLPNLNVGTMNFNPLTTGFTVTEGTVQGRFGTSVKIVSDMNGDQKAEILVGAPKRQNNRGAVFILYGRTNLAEINIDSFTLNPTTNGLRILGAADNDFFGAPINSAGDLNGDGKIDLIIGASSSASSRGVAYVISGDFSAFTSDLDLSTGSLNPAKGFKITGVAQLDQLGSSVSGVGDLNMDGYDDILVGASGKDDYKGAAYVIYGKGTWSDIDLSTPLDIGETGFVLAGNLTNGNFGSSVCRAGDIDGDGSIDLIIGAHNEMSAQGAIYVMHPSRICSPNCKSCSVPSTCDICSYGSELRNSQCIPCAADTFFDSGSCIDCPTACETCTSLTSCQTCQVGKYLLSKSCESCPQNCDTCLDGVNCQACTAPFVLHSQNCHNSCPLTTFQTSSRVCEDCSANCASCTSLTDCQLCNTGFFVSFGLCESCSSDCDTCLDQNICEVCSSSSYKLGNQCVLNCPLGTFSLISPPSVKSCLPCSPHCTSCSSGTFCEGCEVAFYLSSSGSNRFCDSCPSNCQTCLDGSNCTTCFSSHFLYQGECVPECPDNTFSELLNRVCEDCPSNCERCETSPTTCDDCSSGYFLHEGQCVNSCPDSTFASITDKTCKECPQGCYLCTSSTVCQTCVGAYLFYQEQCLLSCPSQTYMTGTACNDCSRNCLECTSASDCQKCVSGHGKLGPECVKCPSGMYLSDGHCLECSQGCFHCVNITMCEKCKEGYTLSESHHLCFEEEDIYFEDEDTAGPVLFEGSSLVGASLGSGSSLPLNFGLVAKILRNMKYLDVKVSPELQETFFSWKVSSGFMSAPKSWSRKSKSKSLPYVFGRYKLEPVFLINFWKPFMMALIGFSLYGTFKCVEMYYEKKDKKSKLYTISRQIHVAASNFALTQFYNNLDDAILYFSIEIRSAEFDNAFRVFSCGFAIILLFAGGMILAVHSSLLSKYQNIKREQKKPQLETFTRKNENINLIFKDFHDVNFLTQSFLLINLIRSLVSSVIFSMLYKYPLLQISLLLVLNLGMLAYLLKRKPFKEIVNTCGQVFCELVLLVANISMLSLAISEENDSTNYSSIKGLSKCVIVLNWALLVGCAVLLLASVGKGFYKSYQEKKKAKTSGLSSEKRSNVDLFNSSKFARPNINIEKPQNESLANLASNNNLSSSEFSNKYENNLYTAHNNYQTAIFESPTMNAKPVSHRYVGAEHNTLSFDTETLPQKSSNEVFSKSQLNDVSFHEPVNIDVSEVNQAGDTTTHENLISQSPEMLPRQRRTKIKRQKNSMKPTSSNLNEQSSPRYNPNIFNELNTDMDHLDMDIIKL